ncbi:MAG TPA: response regulator [Clostridiales bacterium]|jgi:two-component system alkaline phosphatase synthesis response regulator PhoP|nr:response regulator [Clostridiales bacterium]
MIYCVEDDKNIRDLVVYALNTGGLDAVGFPDAESFYKALAERKPVLVLLDIMLPGEDGLAILAKLKRDHETANIPVIMLTAKSSEYDKVQGLDQGADDYIAKPFGVMELMSRIKAVLRRSAPKDASNELKIGPLSLNREQHKVFAEDVEIQLTYKEFQLLNYLMENQGIALTRDKLLKAIWGYDYEGETRTVDVHIGTLRQKLGDAGQLIETVRGIGYRIGGEK